MEQPETLPPNRNYTKPFGLAGLVLAEGYMLYTVLAPRRMGEAVPIAHTISEILVLALFFGVFGAMVGTGIGLVFTGLKAKSAKKRPPEP